LRFRDDAAGCRAATVADLDELCPAKNIIDLPKSNLFHAPKAAVARTVGDRNKTLFDHLMRLARNCDNLDALLDEAFT
jgi:hypothetical protein